MNLQEMSLQDKIRRMHSIQRNTIDDVYDTGFFNGREFCLSLLENREADYKPFRKE